MTILPNQILWDNGMDQEADLMKVKNRRRAICSLKEQSRKIIVRSRISGFMVNGCNM